MKQLFKLTGCLALAGLFASCQSAQQDANYQITVSYTHLDVYKRQVPYPTTITSSKAATSSFITTLMVV